VVGFYYGALLLDTDREKALSLLNASRDAYLLLGWAQDADEIAGLIAQAEAPPGP